MVAPPSVHPSGRIYGWTAGELPAALVDPSEGLVGKLRPPPPREGDRVAPGGTVDRSLPGGDFIARTTWAEVLKPHGWEVARPRRGDVTYWRRPGKDEGVSATTGYVGADALYIFSTNATPLVAGESYTRFGAYAALKHGGDFAAAAATLRAEGYGQDEARSHDGRRRLVVSNPAVVAEKLRRTLGSDELAGVFRRTGELVHTPRIGEDGYLQPDDTAIDLGPAQVRPFTVAQFKTLVEVRYACGVEEGEEKRWRSRLCPREAATSAYEAGRMGEDTPNVRELRGVSHTPTLRPDGSVLDQPGYDRSTGLLYLPDWGLDVPPIPEQPTPTDVREAVALFLTMTDEFPFVEVHHRATWCGLAFTPLLRPLLPPPYQFGIATAPNPGSGKGFLIGMLRDLHSGVLRGEMPREAEELRKTITATLIDTTAPVITFDNLTGVIRSSVLEALLTSSAWSDRYLGHNRTVLATNDRVWVATGNNVAIGGDLTRRTQIMEIDPKRPDPHLRTGFRIHPPTWVPAHRGELLAAMLTIARAWVLDGAPADLTRSDDYALWAGSLTTMLTWAGIEGTFGGASASAHTDSSDDEEWADFLAALHAVFGDAPFTTSAIAERLRKHGWSGMQSSWSSGVQVEAEASLDPAALPGDLAERYSRASYGSDGGFRKSLGWWLRNRTGRYAHGWKVEATSRNQATAAWRVVPPP